VPSIEHSNLINSGRLTYHNFERKEVIDENCKEKFETETLKTLEEMEELDEQITRASYQEQLKKFDNKA